MKRIALVLMLVSGAASCEPVTEPFCYADDSGEMCKQESGAVRNSSGTWDVTLRRVVVKTRVYQDRGHICSWDHYECIIHQCPAVTAASEYDAMNVCYARYPLQ